MSALPERINEILESMDGPDRGRQSRLAEIAGASRQVVNHWLSGVIQSMDFRYAVNIHNQLGWSIDWLISGKTPKKAPRRRSRRLPGRVSGPDAINSHFVRH